MAEHRSATQPGWIAKIVRDAKPGNEFEMKVAGKGLKWSSDKKRRVVEAANVERVPGGWIATCWCETGVAAASRLEIDDYTGTNRNVSFVTWYEDNEAYTIKELELIL